MTVPELIQKFSAEETKVREARAHYTYTQDVLVQTLNDRSAVDGQFHEITTVSYDDKGRRLENVTFGEQSTLREVQLTQTDFDDIRIFMPWILTADEVPQYNLTYAGTAACRRSGYVRVSRRAEKRREGQSDIFRDGCGSTITIFRS